MTNLKRATPFLLVVGDLLALMLFVYIGQRDHDRVNAINPLFGVALTTLPFAVTWLVTGVTLGAYTADIPPRALLARTARVWLIATPLGVTLRALGFNLGAIPTTFMLATYTFVGLFVIGWRAIFIWLTHKRSVNKN